MSEAAGEKWLESLGASTLKEVRVLPAERMLAAQRTRGGPRFWPPIDGYVITGDQYELCSHGDFNDTPILVGKVSDEAAGFGVRKTDPAAFEAMIRGGYGKDANTILAAYPHATDAEATSAFISARATALQDGWEFQDWIRRNH